MIDFERAHKYVCKIYLVATSPGNVSDGALRALNWGRAARVPGDCPFLRVFQKHMVLNIEPGYPKGGQTIHSEDLILATKDGPRVLTARPASEAVPVID